MKMLTVVGARPQFVKAAIVSRALREYNNTAGADSRIDEIILHTGQHYDLFMSEVFFRELGISVPDYQLEINNLSHGAMTGRMLEKAEEIMLAEKPDLVLVYGDTNSTLAGALAAAKQNISLAHVEAGLRSRNRRMPEEINRVLTDHAADLLFCPTAAAVENLAAEGIKRGVYQVGDVMLDAFEYYRQLAGQKSSLLQDLRLVPGSYLLATVHRAENTDDPARLAAILAAFDDLATAEQPLVLPLHPRTLKLMEEHSLVLRRREVKIIPPVGYLDMVALETGAAVILTDSGGVQKEACFAGVPCVTLRQETEWVETVAAGMNVVAGGGTEEIISCCRQLAGRSVPREILPYGDGQAGRKIVEILLNR
ncbi:MAG: UDP-N-acetylglucosamine 2-epimerase (non-hydrolyzing) [Deltaproteobacteria bacterium]|nr:MAG: UDP-N-acetylglucosamine 2-epimerase (non-hydrolyzing) [Deltaproteobacteria bacterium]